MTYNSTKDLIELYFGGKFSMHQDTQSIYFDLDPFNVDKFRGLAFENLGVLLDDESIH